MTCSHLPRLQQTHWIGTNFAGRCRWQARCMRGQSTPALTQSGSRVSIPPHPFQHPHTCSRSRRPATCATIPPPSPTASPKLPLEQQHQPQVLHHQLAYLARQVLVDVLNITANVISLVVLCDKYYYAVFDENIAVPVLDCVAVPHAQYWSLVQTICLLCALAQ
jgi:hypothetical protein